MTIPSQIKGGGKVKKNFFVLAACILCMPFLVPSQADAQRRDRSPDRFTRYDPIIREAAIRYSLPEAFIRAVIRVESNFDRWCVSSSGARGLMQLMPAAARTVGVRDPHDPRQNIMGGTRYLRMFANRYGGNLALTLAAYNAGGGRVARFLRHREPLPPHTVGRYIPRVLQYYREYRAAERRGVRIAHR